VRRDTPAWVGRLARRCAGSAVILPPELHRRFGAEMAETVRRRVESSFVEGGRRAALACAAAELLDILGVTARSRLHRLARPSLGVKAAAVSLAAALCLSPAHAPGPAAAGSAIPSSRSLALLESAAGLSSEDRIRLLQTLAPERFLPASRAAYLRAEETLCASVDYRRLYESLLTDRRLSERDRIAVLAAAATHIDLSRELADLLVRTWSRPDASPAVAAAYDTALRAIDLDRERRRASLALGRDFRSTSS